MTAASSKRNGKAVYGWTNILTDLYNERMSLVKILDGIRVLDWTILQQGSICSSLLGDLGADVIKIEEPVTGDMGRYFDNFFGIKSTLPLGSTYYFEICNRNKRGMTLNLKEEQGRKIFCRLVESCDVLVQNFRVGVAEKLGLDYDTLKKINPRLIYTHATGMGTEGPEAHMPLIDPGALARSGLMWSVGEEGEEEPLPVQGALCDQSGAIFAAYGTLAALLAREKTGRGQKVTSSLLGGIIGLNWINTAIAGWSGRDLPRCDHTHPSSPLSNQYRCKDGQWIMMGAYLEKYFKPFYRASGHPEILNDERFSIPEARSQHMEELVAYTEQIFLEKPLEEWIKILKKEDIICEPIRHTSELLTDQQAFQNGYLTHYHHPRFGQDIVEIGSPVQFSEADVDIQRPAPMLSEHTEEILAEMGYSKEEIVQFRRGKII